MHRHIRMYVHAHIHTRTIRTCLLYISSSVGVEYFPLNELPFGSSVHSRGRLLVVGKEATPFRNAVE